MDLIVVGLGFCFLGWVIICVRERTIIFPIQSRLVWRRSPPGGIIYDLGCWIMFLAFVLTFLIRVTEALGHWFPAVILLCLLLIAWYSFEIAIKDKVQEARLSANGDHNDAS